MFSCKRWSRICLNRWSNLGPGLWTWDRGKALCHIFYIFSFLNSQEDDWHAYPYLVQLSQVEGSGKVPSLWHVSVSFVSNAAPTITVSCWEQGQIPSEPPERFLSLASVKAMASLLEHQFLSECMNGATWIAKDSKIPFVSPSSSSSSCRSRSRTEMRKCVGLSS